MAIYCAAFWLLPAHSLISIPLPPSPCSHPSCWLQQPLCPNLGTQRPAAKPHHPAPSHCADPRCYKAARGSMSSKNRETQQQRTATETPVSETKPIPQVLAGGSGLSLYGQTSGTGQIKNNPQETQAPQRARRTQPHHRSTPGCCPKAGKCQRQAPCWVGTSWRLGGCPQGGSGCTVLRTALLPCLGLGRTKPQPGESTGCAWPGEC